jgi:hypothetical protein
MSVIDSYLSLPKSLGMAFAGQLCSRLLMQTNLLVKALMGNVG